MRHANETHNVEVIVRLTSAAVTGYGTKHRTLNDKKRERV